MLFFENSIDGTQFEVNNRTRSFQCSFLAADDKRGFLFRVFDKVKF